ncbi:MAG: OB-fold domain-containing protein [Polyangiales bacterium]
MSDKKEVPAIQGWFTSTPEGPSLLGTRCVKCGTYFFPKEKTFCRNPGCAGTEFEEVPLSRTGTLWSYTNAGYQPPEPFIPAKLPFEPFAIAAVTLEKEKLSVLGMCVEGVRCEDLKVGMKMELVLGTLHEDAENRYLTWKWRPVAG